MNWTAIAFGEITSVLLALLYVAGFIAIGAITERGDAG